MSTSMCGMSRLVESIFELFRVKARGNSSIKMAVNCSSHNFLKY